MLSTPQVAVPSAFTLCVVADAVATERSYSGMTAAQRFAISHPVAVYQKYVGNSGYTQTLGRFHTCVIVEQRSLLTCPEWVVVVDYGRKLAARRKSRQLLTAVEFKLRMRAVRALENVGVVSRAVVHFDREALTYTEHRPLTDTEVQVMSKIENSSLLGTSQ